MDFTKQGPLTFQPKEADKQIMWQTLIDQARDKINESDWEGASVIYNKAFALAEQMMCKKSCSKNCSVSQYLNTAAEFAFVMKQNNYECALAQFMGQIQNSLAEQNTALSQEELIEHLESASCPAGLWVDANH